MVGGTTLGDPRAEPRDGSGYLPVAQPVLQPYQRGQVALRYLSVLTFYRSCDTTGQFHIPSDAVGRSLEPDRLQAYEQPIRALRQQELGGQFRRDEKGRGIRTLSPAWVRRARRAREIVHVV